MKDFDNATDGTGTTSATRKVHLLLTILCGEVLREFGVLASQVGSTANDHIKLIKDILLGYFPPINALNKQKRAMRRAMPKPQDLLLKRFLLNWRKWITTFHFSMDQAPPIKCPLKNWTRSSFMPSPTREGNKSTYRDGILKEVPTRRHAICSSKMKSQIQYTKEDHLPKILKGPNPPMPVFQEAKRRRIRLAIYPLEVPLCQAQENNASHPSDFPTGAKNTCMMHGPRNSSED